MSVWNQCQTVDRFRRQWNFHHENDENENAKPIRFTSSTTDAPIPMTLSLTIALFVDCANRNYILHAWIYGNGDKWWMHSDIHALNKSRTTHTHTQSIRWELVRIEYIPICFQWTNNKTDDQYLLGWSHSLSLSSVPVCDEVKVETGQWTLDNECGRYRQWIATCLCLCVQWTIVIFFPNRLQLVDTGLCVCECVPQNLEDCTCTVHGVIDDDWDLDFMWVGNSCSNYVIRNSLYFMVYANLDNGK